MKIRIISPGRFENSPYFSVFNDYCKRLKIKLELVEFEVKNSKNIEISKLKDAEEKLINKHLYQKKSDLTSQKATIAILDENGSQFTSKDFAKFISTCQNKSTNELCFVIGGAAGLSDNIKQQAKIKISLGAMTYPHLMVRCMLVEQIYRAYTIIENHPYHRQ